MKGQDIHHKTTKPTKHQIHHKTHKTSNNHKTHKKGNKLVGHKQKIHDMVFNRPVIKHLYISIGHLLSK
jgi:hypothetical protein